MTMSTDFPRAGYPIAEAADALGMPVSAVRERVRAGTIPSSTIDDTLVIPGEWLDEVRTGTSAPGARSRRVPVPAHLLRWLAVGLVRDETVSPAEAPTTMDLYRAYVRWCDGRGIRPASVRLFVRELVAAGHRVTARTMRTHPAGHVRQGRFVEGARLATTTR